MKTRKQTIKLAGLLMLFIMIVTMGGCSSGKKTLRNDFGKPLDVPCETKTQRTDRDYIRASHVARSSDLTLSKDKAFLVTQERLASLVESSVRSTARRYANERNVSMDFDLAEQFEVMMIRSANSTNHMMRIICEETYVSDRRVYTTAMALEISKAEILEAIMNEQNRRRYFQLEDDMEKFKKIFEEETTRPVMR